ncbi:DUF2624 domain-containing protein [Metabacillus sp. GX 13764]|uniref:DUF2624 family protein n=1 Tax=Metabacillus kandeliae TaxID=2900151 RepID=UPI001E4D0F1C|nr:DUF2624 family protein [Metabacillus kandeliae]MCD7033079.1 DUF2624 domain-containing protein [Metabacillus kandeliae]
MILFQKIINQKLSGMSESELLQLAKQNKIVISQAQASKITALIKGSSINIFDEQERNELLKKVAQITSKETADQVGLLLKKFTG